MNKGSIWLAASLYINSVAASVIIGWLLASPESTEIPTPPEADVVTGMEEIRSVEELIESGDRALARGNWSRALAHFRTARQMNSNDPWLTYRLAVVNEATANLSTATSRFLDLATSREPFLADASQIGLSRISMANGNWSEARDNLWRLFLQQSGERDALHHAEIIHSIARANGEELVAKGQKPKVDHMTPLYLTLPLDTTRLIQELKDRKKAVSSSEKRKSDHQGTVQPQDPATDFFMSPGKTHGNWNQRVSAKAANIGLLELLTSFAGNYGFEVAYSETAEKTVRRHSVRLDVSRIPIQTFLYATLSSHKLCWFRNNNRIEIISIEDFDADGMKVYSYRMSSYLLRSAIFDYPDHPLVNQTRILLALVEFQRQRWSSTRSMLQEVIRDRTLSRTMRNMALFNLGKALYNLGQNAQATRTMYLVGDDLYGGNVSATAIMIAANEEVNLGNYEKAVRNNSQAIALANTDEIRARAALAMVVAYLLDGKPFMANQSIVQQRRRITQTEHVMFATFLSALARFQVSRSRGNGNTSELLRAVLAFEKFRDKLNAEQHQQAAILVAEAKIILGFEQEAIEELFQVAESATQSPLRDRVANLIGETVAALDSNSRMAAFYERMMKAKLFQSADIVKDLRLARAQFDSGEFDKCIETCERMIENTSEPAQIRRILELQGKANQRLGNFYAAALCFAGVSSKTETGNRDQENLNKQTTGQGGATR